jgi:hypothetical protein
MKSTTAAFCVVIIIGAGVFARSTLGQDERERLCHSGHPVHRATGITYGGKPVIHGYERDHVIPLSLGGPDVASNVQYQRCDRWGPHGCAEGPAAVEDEAEWSAAGDYCRGTITLREARTRVAKVKEQLR